MSYLADLRKILFWKKALICDNVIVRTLANSSKCSIGLILSKYCIQSISVNTNDIKLQMWKHFDILLLSGSCTGLQYMVNVCVQLMVK